MKPISKHIFLRLLLPTTAGIAAGSGWTFSSSTCLLMKGAVVILLLIILLLHVNYLKYGVYKKAWLMGVLFQLFLFLLMSVHTASTLPDHQSRHFSHHPAKSLLVEVCTEPQEKTAVTRCEVRVLKAIDTGNTAQLRGKLLISVRKEPSQQCSLTIGDRLVLPGRFIRIPGPQNPGEFDYAAYMANNGVRHQAFFNASDVVHAGRSTGRLIYAAVALRKKAVGILYRYIDNEEAAAIISTLLLGYKADLSKSILNTYSATGVMHVLSVSGMHVAIVAALAGYLLGIWKGRKMNIVQAILIIGFVWLYTLISGLSAAACRSAVMISFAIAGRLMDRNAEMLNCVSAAAFFQLLCRPLWMFDIGFQLSYLAVFGLVVLYPAISGFKTFESPYLKALWSYIAFSIAAQLATFPLCLYYFNQFPLYFLASNLFIMLPVTVVMYAGVGFLLLALIPSAAGLPLTCLAWLMENGVDVLNSGLRVIEKLPFSSLHGYKLHVSFYLLVYLLIAAVYTAVVRKSKQAVWFSLIVLLAVTLSYSVCGILIWQRKSVVFFSVRKHIAVAFIRRGMATVVGDMKSGDAAIAYSVLPCVRERNLYLTRIVDLAGNFYEEDLKLSHGNIRFYDVELQVIRDPLQLNNLKAGPANEGPGRKPAKLRRLILLAGNPKLHISDLLMNFDVSQVVIAADNNADNTERWMCEADSLGIPCHALKKMGSFEHEIKAM